MVIYVIRLLHVVCGSVEKNTLWLFCHVIRIPDEKPTTLRLVKLCLLLGSSSHWFQSAPLLSLSTCIAKQSSVDYEYYKYFLEILPVTSVFPLGFTNTDLPASDFMACSKSICALSPSQLCWQKSSWEHFQIYFKQYLIELSQTTHLKL